MTTTPPQSESGRLAGIEQRLRALEDAEAIRNLKARYAAYCDAQYNCDGIAALFTEDAVWDSPSLGHFEGREAIREIFREASRVFTFAIHYSLNASHEHSLRDRLGKDAVRVKSQHMFGTRNSHAPGRVSP